MIINGEQLSFSVGMDGAGNYGVTMTIVNDDGLRIVFLLPPRTARAYARILSVAADQVEAIVDDIRMNAADEAPEADSDIGEVNE
jgi:hypothetical protein